MYMCIYLYMKFLQRPYTCYTFSSPIATVTQIEKVFGAASHKKVWDHFTKAQRKNIDVWKKQALVRRWFMVNMDDVIIHYRLSPIYPIQWFIFLLFIKFSIRPNLHFSIFQITSRFRIVITITIFFHFCLFIFEVCFFILILHAWLK